MYKYKCTYVYIHIYIYIYILVLALFYNCIGLFGSGSTTKLITSILTPLYKLPWFHFFRPTSILVITSLCDAL